MVEELVQQYLNQMTAEQVLMSDAYFEGGYWLTLWDFLIGLILAYLFLFKGWSKKIAQFSQNLFKKSFLQDMVYYGIYLLASTLLFLPWAFYKGYFREHKYELSNLSFIGWVGEEFKGLAVGIVVGSLLVATLYKVIRRLGDKWWIVGSLVATGFLAFFMLVFPVFVAPIFNTYKPLAPGPVKESILSMARSNGIDVSEIYQFDASKQSKRISANVSGLGGTMRISLNDNLLNRTSLEEIEAVMAHEIGHYVLNHIYESLIYLSILFLLGFAFTHWVMIWAIERWGNVMGVKSVLDISGFPLALAILSTYFYMILPLANSITRTNEAEADIFGLNLARRPDGFAKVALKLSEYRKISPGPLEEIVFFDHPSGENRIRMAMQWKVNLSGRDGVGASQGGADLKGDFEAKSSKNESK